MGKNIGTAAKERASAPIASDLQTGRSSSLTGDAAREGRSAGTVKYELLILPIHVARRSFLQITLQIISVSVRKILLQRHATQEVKVLYS